MTLGWRGSAGAVFAALAFQVAGCGGGGGAAALAPLTGVVAISAGDSHACARLADGTARCWGGNVFGELGNGKTSYAEPTPVTVSGVTGLRAIAAGPSHTCALATDGRVLCWGNNTFGQLGNGSALYGLPGDLAGTLSMSTPVAVKGLDGSVTALVAGPDHQGEYTCALMSDGTAQCWGEDELGLGPAPLAGANAPALMPVTGVTQLALGVGFACALLRDATVECWGLGPLGQAGITGSTTPLPVSGLPAVTALVAGKLHACALIADGTVQCWGTRVVAGPPGETATDSDTPVAITGLAGVATIAAAGYRTCALLVDGTVRCWGDSVVLMAALVPGVTRATAIAMGTDLTCALIAGGTVQCWGDDSQGQVGNGIAPTPTAIVSTPTTVVSGPQ